ncbi:MAG: hypothetical protein ACOYKN_21615 [Pirellula sp.]
MRINLFETSMVGHRPRYLREITLGLKANRKDCELRLCIFGRDRETPGYIEFLGPLEDLFRVCPLPNRTLKGRFRSEITRLRLLHECVVANPCDRVIIPYGDGLVPMMGVLPKWLIRKIVPAATQMESMVFRTEWTYPSVRWAEHYYHRLRRWGVCRWPGRHLHLSDFNAWQRADRKLDRYSASVSLVPEVFEDWTQSGKKEALEWLKSLGFFAGLRVDLDWGLPVISSPGSPSDRKGTAELLEAFAINRELEGTLLLWGRIPERVEQVLSRRGVSWRDDPRIVVIEKYIDEQAFRALFSITDVVVLPYQRHLGGVSSLYMLGAIHRKKTICDNRAWLGWAAEHYQHGLAIECSRPEEMQRAFVRVLSGISIPMASEKAAAALRSECMHGQFRKCWGCD